MKNTCGQRQAAICTMKGLMLTTDEAYKMGMVDEVVPADQVETRAQEEIKSWLKIPGKLRIKLNQRTLGPEALIWHWVTWMLMT